MRRMKLLKEQLCMIMSLHWEWIDIYPFSNTSIKLIKTKKNKRAKLTIDYKLLPHDKAKEKDDQFNYNEVVYCEECNFEWTNETDDD